MRAVSSVLVSLFIVCPSSAQRLPPPLPGAVSASRSTPAERSAPATASQPQPASSAGAIVGAGLGTAAGSVGLAALVYAACWESCDSSEGLAVVVGGMLGEVLIASFATHMGNQYAGSFALDLAAAGGIAVAGVAGAAVGGGAGVLVAAAVVQAVVLVVVERAKGAQKARAAASAAR